MAAKKSTSNVYFNPGYKDEENVQEIQFKWELKGVKYEIHIKRLTKIEFTPFMRHCTQLPYYVKQAIGGDESEKTEKKIEKSCMQLFPRTLSPNFISAWTENNGSKTFKSKLKNFINKFYKANTSFSLIEEI
ncbi:hypothetical protein FisN_8Lu411 [Fistulifera solaris]|uniref:Uncharacterized protein n=1 Tax=Fistulifera solaris TaxID=1519565 RepID=A0A1Z5JHX3_FISSO|nr:hypothetical protein FisN_8Lu411 [Fistulifera solaris]|eukprot:GAX13368.1 hypothetical protein FisN_8Lu411 [Fistulifera solaris]